MSKVVRITRTQSYRAVIELFGQNVSTENAVLIQVKRDAYFLSHLPAIFFSS